MGSKIGKNSASGKGLSLPMDPCDPADHISLEITTMVKQALQSFYQAQ